MMSDDSVKEHEAIGKRAREVMLKLLGAIEQVVDRGLAPNEHVDAYEALCRAEATRSHIDG
jgi:hypothetical protein